MKRKSLVLSVMASLVVTACQVPATTAQIEQKSTYSRNELSRSQKTAYGKLLSFKPIHIQGEGSLIATGLGAGLAGYGASHIGGGKAKYASAAVGAAIGGVFMDEFMKAWSESAGVELTVQFKDGSIATFAQEGNAKEWIRGQQVKVTKDANGKVRVDNANYL